MPNDATTLPNAPPREHVVKRDGDRDMAFTGWLLGEAATASRDQKRGTAVRVYLTTGRRIIVSVDQVTHGQPGGLHRAAAHETPAAALVWLRQDAGGALGPASKQAWEQACASWPGLKGEEVERIE